MITKKFNNSLFIFRRDLRLEDNAGLIAALADSQWVMPAFIFDPRQIDDQPYLGKPSVSFLAKSLMDLEEQLNAKGARLFIFYGQPHVIVERLILERKIDAVFTNIDYTPFSLKRDASIKAVCQHHHIHFQQTHDALLNAPQAVLKDDGKPYTVYTPYARKAMTFKVALPQANKFTNYVVGTCSFEDRKKFDALKALIPDYPLYPGGRNEALGILKNIKQYKSYDEERDFPALAKTTKLSAHHKFGTCSVRESYHAIVKAFGTSHTLIRELYWRDFFTQIGSHFPRVMGKSFYEKYDALVWENNETYFKAWCNGETGFPIVDAGMKELNQTGFMHNRVRMITASFLIKDLHIDWRLGEQYFAKHLVDYDPLVNNGNWQWAASTGCDAAPYFRIFNPWLQQKKFDPDARYIKKWLPELGAVSAKDIHDIAIKGLKFDGYPSPIVWHEEERGKALSAYGKIF